MAANCSGVLVDIVGTLHRELFLQVLNRKRFRGWPRQSTWAPDSFTIRPHFTISERTRILCALASGMVGGMDAPWRLRGGLGAWQALPVRASRSDRGICGNT